MYGKDPTEFAISSCSVCLPCLVCYPNHCYHYQLISCFDNGLDFQIVVWKAASSSLSPYSIRRGCGYTVSFWEIHSIEAFSKISKGGPSSMKLFVGIDVSSEKLDVCFNRRQSIVYLI